MFGFVVFSIWNCTRLKQGCWLVSCCVPAFCWLVFVVHYVDIACGIVEVGGIVDACCAFERVAGPVFVVKAFAEFVFIRQTHGFGMVKQMNLLCSSALHLSSRILLFSDVK